MPRPEKVDSGYTPKTQSEAFKQGLYGELTTPEAVDAALKEKEAKKKEKGAKNIYFWMCNFTEKHFLKKVAKTYERPEQVEVAEKKKKAKVLPKEYREALDFLGWKIDHETVMAVPKTAGILGLIIGIILALVMYSVLTLSAPSAGVCGDGVCSSIEKMKGTCPQDCAASEEGLTKSAVGGGGGVDPLILLFILFIPVFSTLGFVSYIQKYPLNTANTEKLRALTYVPEIINYLIMEMRLQPNLERAVEFASEHGEGRIAEEFRELLWKGQVGVYGSIEEGLDDMAYRWEPYSEEFKHAITMIRASVLVPSDIERGVLYDKILDDILTSTRDKMELYANSMKQPSMYLFYIAVLLPLMVIIMLPVAAAFGGLPVASTPVLIALYIFIMPMITYFYAKSVLSKRPGGYVPPEIPDGHPELPKKGTAIIKGMKLPIVPVTVMLFIVVLGLGMFADASVKMSPSDFAREQALNPEKDIQQPIVIQYFIPLVLAIPTGFYLFAKGVNKRQVQEKIFKMELDFKDAMYLLASRLGEKKPLEDAITYVEKFMPESKVATELLENVQRNVMVMGLTLRSAIFDPVYGAMKNIPSRLMNSAFKIMTDSIELGPEVASVSLISVSDQIRNVQKINDLMRKQLDDVTSMMSSMATFIAPIVLGIVASLQKVIIAVISPLSQQTSSITAASAGNEALTQAGSSLGGGLVDQNAFKNMAGPVEFQLIVAIYVLELVIMLSYFAGKVKYGDNKAAIMVTIGRTLPIAMIVFVAALYMGGSMIGGLAG